MEIDLKLDTGVIATAMSQRAASAIAKRADQLGTAGVKTIKGWIDTELHPSKGSAERHGAVSMRDLNWDYRVDNPGTLPVSATVFCTDIDAEPTKAKFWSLNSGHKAFKQVPKSGNPMRFAAYTRGTEKVRGTVGFFTRTTRVRSKDQVVTAKSVKQPATTGHDWVRRLGEYMVFTANARFIGSKNFPAPRRRR